MQPVPDCAVRHVPEVVEQRVPEAVPVPAFPAPTAATTIAADRVILLATDPVMVHVPLVPMDVTATVPDLVPDNVSLAEDSVLTDVPRAVRWEHARDLVRLHPVLHAEERV